MSEAVDQGGRFVAVFNKYASNILHDSDTSDREYGSLHREYGTRVIPIETDSDPDKTAEDIAKTLEPGDVLIPFGGDYTFGVAASALRRPEIKELGDATKKLADTTIVPGRFGNGNLAARELIKPLPGQKEPPRLLDLLRHGQVIDSFGFDVTVESLFLDEPQTYLAMVCGGVHASGRVSDGLNQVRHHPWRKSEVGRWWIDGQAALKAVKSSEIIQIEIDGEQTEAAGVINVNTDHYIKFLKTPSSIAEQAFHDFVLTDNTYRYLASLYMRHTVSELPWRKINGGESTSYKVVAKKGQRLSFDVDAERYLLPSDPNEEVESTITVSPSTQRVRVATTNQRLIDKAERLNS